MQLHRGSFSFTFEGRRFGAWICQAGGQSPRAGIMLVPGHGKTDAEHFCLDFQEKLAAQGFVCCTWDRPGCGKSEGVYDHYQSVENSAQEAVAAFGAFAATTGLPAERIGFWGISRAGWICALAIPSLPATPAFWISISSGGPRDNYAYLLEENFRREGKTEDQVRYLLAQFWQSVGVLIGGGDYEQCLAAMPDLKGESLFELLGGSLPPEEYRRMQDRHVSGEYRLDATAENARTQAVFNALASVKCPVLALFGENDTNVDWREAARLYREALTSGGNSDFTVQTIPGANHVMSICKTGTVREMLAIFHAGTHKPCDQEIQFNWLTDRGFALASPPGVL